MSKTVKFVIHDHHAIKAGYHQDLRFQNPEDTRHWYSFAIPKGVPLQTGTKVLAIRTHMHTEEEALFQGEIPPGEYGGGTLAVFDQGLCQIHKLTSAHIMLLFQGSKVKGLYHLISTGNIRAKEFKQQQYMMFKSKERKHEPLKIGGMEMAKYLMITKRLIKLAKGRIA